MLRHDYRDLICGSILTAVGIGAAIYAAMNYQLGTLARMGPGLAFVALGIVLAGLGLLIAIPALFRSGVPVNVEIRPFFAIVAALMAFPIVMPVFGLLPAVAATSLIGSLADGRSRVRSALLLAGFLTVLCYAIFIFGLRLNMPAFRFPF